MTADINMKEIRSILESIQLPKMIKVRQSFVHDHLEQADISREIKRIFENEAFISRIKKGDRVALTAGSREIRNIAFIIKEVVSILHAIGAKPFIVPAMGSHGGARAEGQKKLIEGYGITEEYCGCPIYSSMDTVHIGNTEDGQRVFLDKNAYEADGIIVIGRVKPHTDFRGQYESGIMKMMAVGLGKQKGAQACHRLGFGHMADNIVQFGRAVLKNAPIIGAVAILENAFDQTKEIVGILPEDIENVEPILLERARENMPKILIDECDVLIVDEIGKNFSGIGMDSNITGRHATKYSSGGIHAQRVAVLGLSKKTHNNGYGIGLADAIPRKVLTDLDTEAMYVNALTSGIPSAAYIPPVFPDEKSAVQACIKMCVGIEEKGPRVIRIKNTLDLEEILVSQNLKETVLNTAGMTITEENLDMTF